LPSAFSDLRNGNGNAGVNLLGIEAWWQGGIGEVYGFGLLADEQYTGHAFSPSVGLIDIKPRKIYYACPALRQVILCQVLSAQRTQVELATCPPCAKRGNGSLFYQRLAAGISNIVPTRHLSSLRSKLAKEAPVISPHPLLDQMTVIVEPEDV
jgi:hypothetical protein